jgi:tRNA pseudouridine38-40 synthase
MKMQASSRGGAFGIACPGGFLTSGGMAWYEGAMERRAWALLLRYDGNPYKGWQPHPDLPTVGGVVKSALARCGVGATPYGASRTDAGVHARAQVASFSSRADLDPASLLPALNAELPATIRALCLRAAPKSFHAHWSSIGKVYRYRISFSGEGAAWRLPAARFPYSALDAPKLAEALSAIASAPDVSALSGPGDRDSKARAIDEALVIECSPAGATLQFRAAGFGKYLVRHLVGAALGYAVGAYRREELEGILSGALPKPPRADPDGLTLYRVLYPSALDPFPDAERLAS